MEHSWPAAIISLTISSTRETLFIIAAPAPFLRKSGDEQPRFRLKPLKPPLGSKSARNFA